MCIFKVSLGGVYCHTWYRTKSFDASNCYSYPLVQCLISVCLGCSFHAFFLVLSPGWQNNEWSTYGEDCCASWDSWAQARLLLSIQILPPCRQERQQTVQGLYSPLKHSLSAFMSLSVSLSLSVFLCLWLAILLPFTPSFFPLPQFLSVSLSDLISVRIKGLHSKGNHSGNQENRNNTHMRSFRGTHTKTHTLYIIITGFQAADNPVTVDI